MSCESPSRWQSRDLLHFSVANWKEVNRLLPDFFYELISDLCSQLCLIFSSLDYIWIVSHSASMSKSTNAEVIWGCFLRWCNVEGGEGEAKVLNHGRQLLIFLISHQRFFGLSNRIWQVFCYRRQSDSVQLTKLWHITGCPKSSSKYDNQSPNKLFRKCRTYEKRFDCFFIPTPALIALNELNSQTTPN